MCAFLGFCFVASGVNNTVLMLCSHFEKQSGMMEEMYMDTLKFFIMYVVHLLNFSFILFAFGVQMFDATVI